MRKTKLKPEELLSLQKFLNTEFKLLAAPQEAKWVFEELQSLEALSAFERAEEILLRRKKGEALAYILGHWDFRRLQLSVGPGVLIPRPETEELVDFVLKHLSSKPISSAKVADLGAGSGAIAYALADESPVPLDVYAVEKSGEAFAFLEKNLQSLTPEKQKSIHLIHSDWSSAALPELDVLVSNPPYVSLEEYLNLEPGVRDFEPKSALVPEDETDAMAAYKSLLSVARKLLKPGGALFFEFGPAQESLWAPLMGEFQWQIFKDLSGKARFLYAFDFKPQNR